MAKKGSRLRQFEKTHRVLDITSAQEERRKRRQALGKQENKEAAYAIQQPADTLYGQEDDISVAVAAEAAPPMVKSKKTKGKGKKVKFRVIALAITIVFVFMVGASAKNIADLKERETALLEKQEELTKKIEDLTMELENVSTKEYIEEQARKTLKLVKDDELIFYFPDDLNLSGDEADSDEDTTQDEN